MEREAHVLQQRVEPPALRRRRVDALERVRRTAGEGVEPEPDEACAASVAIRFARGGAARTARQPARQRQSRSPTAASSLVVAPRPGELEDQRLRQVRVAPPARPTGRCAEQQHQRAERQRAEQRLGHAAAPRPAARQRRRPPSRRPIPTAEHSCSRPAPLRATARQAGFGDHCEVALRAPGRASARSCPRARRHIVLVVLGEDVGGDEACRRLERAFGDHARPSTNRSGTMPVDRTGTRALPSPTTKSIVTPSARVLSEPCSTMPPSRIAWPAREDAAAMSLGT